MPCIRASSQQAEHTQLAKPPPNINRVYRAQGNQTSTSGGAVDAAVDDRWTSDAPSWLVGVDPPEDQPGSILPAQRSQIMAVYASLGIKDRAKRIEDVNAVLASGEHGPVLAGPVESVNELSHKQAARLLENLHDRHTGKMTRR